MVASKRLLILGERENMNGRDYAPPQIREMETNIGGKPTNLAMKTASYFPFPSDVTTIINGTYINMARVPRRPTTPTQQTETPRPPLQ